MISMFQGWRFQRWRQASLWTAKKIRKQRIRGITRRRSKSNAREACRIIGGNSTNRFCTIESHGNDSKTRKLGAYELKSRDIERRFFTCEQIQRQQRKGFLHRIVTGDEKWIFYDNPKKKKLRLPSISTPRPNIHGSKIVLCIWWEKRSCLLWAAETWRFHYGRSVSATIDWSFESCIARKTVGIRAKTW